MEPKIFFRQLQEIAEINSDLAGLLAKIIRERVPLEIAVKPASSTGKHHPDFDNGISGTIYHTVAVYNVAKDLINNMYENCPAVVKVNILAACLMHDMMKYGIDGKAKYTVFEHPILMADILREYDLHEIADLVASHMGRWNTSKYSKTVLPIPQTQPAMIVHMADWIASRQYIKESVLDKDEAREIFLNESCEIYNNAMKSINSMK